MCFCDFSSFLAFSSSFQALITQGKKSKLADKHFNEISITGDRFLAEMYMLNIEEHLKKVVE
jgi:hypothetical protein